ncbi:MAG: serine acetyltransferase [Bacteroidales bacterium]|nr:serine acetyltransferase [Bacteroidales bacterium]
MRICSYLRSRKLLFPIYLIYRLKLNRLSYKSGIQIPDTTQIGKGFYIGHFGCIVISAQTIIGNNVNISQGITIGRTNRGEKQGVPTIGNDVYIGPGAKIIGKINIGDNITIGANAVVTSDVPDNACVAGIPAKIISYAGSEGYVNRKVK